MRRKYDPVIFNMMIRFQPYSVHDISLWIRFTIKYDVLYLSVAYRFLIVRACLLLDSHFSHFNFAYNLHKYVCIVFCCIFPFLPLYQLPTDIYITYLVNRMLQFGKNVIVMLQTDARWGYSNYNRSSVQSPDLLSCVGVCSLISVLT